LKEFLKEAVREIQEHPEDGKVAFEKIYSYCFPYGKEVAYRILGSYHDAEEVSQQALINVWDEVRKFRGDSKFTTWFHSIVENLARNKYRWNKTRGSQKNTSFDEYFAIETEEGVRHSLGALDEHARDPYEVENLDELFVDTAKALKELPEHYRQVLVLNVVDGKTYEEIAQIFQVPLGTIKSRINRAREELRKRVGM